VGLPAPGRWERLFADHEGMADAAEWAELTAEVQERSRGEIGRVRLTDRIRAAAGHRVEVALRTGQRLRGVVADSGPDWLLLAEAGPQETLVAVQGVEFISGLGALSASPGSEGRVSAALGLRYALRRLVQGRERVTVTLTGGSCLPGTLDRVGSDYVEIAEHEIGEFRRRSAVRGVHTVPLSALVFLRPA
jgi:small nuclear ribonucleoprotein (snRNP)-like protein